MIGVVGVASSKNAYPSVERFIRVLMCVALCKTVHFFKICNNCWLQDVHSEYLVSITSMQNLFLFLNNRNVKLNGK